MPPSRARSRTRLLPAFGVASIALASAGGCDVGGGSLVRSSTGSTVNDSAVEVPFRLAGGGATMLVPVHVNGQGPFELVFDTGASMTCVDPVAAGEIGLKTRGGIRGVGVGVGGAGQVRLVSVDSMRVGGARATELTACVIDLPQVRQVSPSVRGLLGLNFLSNFLVTIDFERKVVRLDPR